VSDFPSSSSLHSPILCLSGAGGPAFSKSDIQFPIAHGVSRVFPTFLRLFCLEFVPHLIFPLFLIGAILFWKSLAVRLPPPGSPLFGKKVVFTPFLFFFVCPQALFFPYSPSLFFFFPTFAIKYFLFRFYILCFAYPSKSRIPPVLRSLFCQSTFSDSTCPDCRRFCFLLLYD